jgi:hypothetical protein
MWRRRHKQSALSRQLALARLEEALVRVEESQRNESQRNESQRSDEEPGVPGPGGRANRTQAAPSRDVSIPAQRSSGRAAQLVYGFFQARGRDGRDG